MAAEGEYEVIPESKASSALTQEQEIRYDNVGLDLPFRRDRLTIEGELGSGAFGTVLLATAIGIKQSTSRTKVAVKTLRGNCTLALIKTSNRPETVYKLVEGNYRFSRCLHQ